MFKELVHYTLYTASSTPYFIDPEPSAIANTYLLLLVARSCAEFELFTRPVTSLKSEAKKL